MTFIQTHLVEDIGHGQADSDRGQLAISFNRVCTVFSKELGQGSFQNWHKHLTHLTNMKDVKAWGKPEWPDSNSKKMYALCNRFYLIPYFLSLFKICCITTRVAFHSEGMHRSIYGVRINLKTKVSWVLYLFPTPSALIFLYQNGLPPALFSLVGFFPQVTALTPPPDTAPGPKFLGV